MKSGEIDLDQLREMYLAAEFPMAYRVVLMGASVGLLLLVLSLVRRRVLREEYTPIWVVVSAGIFLFSIRYDWLQSITRAIGAWDPVSIVYFLGELFLVALCLNYAVRLSKYGVLIKNLGQEAALLRAHVADLERRLGESA
jgi:hypothetical protein